jgi:hypothetical protein
MLEVSKQVSPHNAANWGKVKSLRALPWATTFLASALLVLVIIQNPQVTIPEQAAADQGS